MRYRILSPTGDYVFGLTTSEFLINSPAAVAQAVLTSLKLLQGEWFLDSTQGTPWLQDVIGTNTAPLYDQVIRAAIAAVPGVNNIVSYSSSRSAARALTITVTLDTIYGQTSELTIPLNPPIGFGE